MLPALRHVGLALLKLPFFVLLCVLWVFIGALLALVRWMRDGPGWWGSDASTETLDEAHAGWLGGFLNIWQAFYGPA